MQVTQTHILSWILFTTVIGAIVLLFVPRRLDNAQRVIGNVFGMLGLVVSLPLIWRFQIGTPGYQFRENYDWIPSIGAHYSLGIDGISFLLIMLTTLLGAISILSSWSAIQQFSPILPRILFWGFFFAFAIKVPMFPFHTWLPDAHTEAPTAGSVILAGVLLKMGTYGFIRFSLPLLPTDGVARQHIVNILMVLSIVGIIYGALVCMMQKDMKKLIAYSSVSHLGFCTLGIFALNPHGVSGSVIQQINHGISTGALFLIVGVLYERRHTRLISEYGGLSTPLPNFAAIYMIATLSSLGLPLLNGFIGEFTILSGVFQVSLRWTAWAVVGLVLGAVYLLL